MEIIITIDICYEFVVKKSKLDILRPSKTSTPCKQTLSIDTFAFNWPSTYKRQSNLRTKTCCKPETVLQIWIISTFRQVQIAQFFIHNFVVRNRRNSLLKQTIEHTCIFDSNSHRMSCESFGICNHHGICTLTKGLSQCFDFALGTTATSRRVCLMRIEYQIFGNCMSIQTPALFH